MADQQKYINKLRDTRALIIGGSSGLGYGLAEALIEYGASAITISSSSQSRIDSAISSLKKSYPSAKTTFKGIQCDLGNEDTLEQNVKSLFEQVETVDHIIFTAGDKLASKSIEEIDFAFIKKAGLVRFFAPLLVARYGKAKLSEGPKSSIVLTTGAVSEHPIPNWSVVGSYASGLQAMTRNLALDLKPVRVNLISPGGVKTELWDASVPKDKQEEFFANMGKNTATGKIGQVEDVVHAYLYCLMDHNITGSMISTNSGSMLK